MSRRPRSLLAHRTDPASVQRLFRIVGPWLLFDGWLRSSTQTPEDEPLKATDVLTAPTGGVVVETRAVCAVGTVSEAGELDVVRLSAARHLGHAASWLAWLVAGRSHPTMLPQSRRRRVATRQRGTRHSTRSYCHNGLSCTLKRARVAARSARGGHEVKSADLWSNIHAERTALVQTLASLTSQQWASASLCGAWSVQEVTGHLVSAAEQTPPNFLKELALAGFSFDTFVNRDAKRIAATGTSELVRRLQARTTTTNHPPGPASAMLGEIVVHGEDIRRAGGGRRRVEEVEPLDRHEAAHRGRSPPSDGRRVVTRRRARSVGSYVVPRYGHDRATRVPHGPQRRRRRAPRRPRVVTLRAERDVDADVFAHRLGCALKGRYVFWGSPLRRQRVEGLNERLHDERDTERAAKGEQQVARLE